jgi:hypothetical protein
MEHSVREWLAEDLVEVQLHWLLKGRLKKSRALLEIHLSQNRLSSRDFSLRSLQQARR